MTATPDALFGAWKLVAAFFALPDGSRLDVYGPAPAGRLILTREGWMTALLTAPDRAASPDPAVQAMAAMAYTGHFVADGASFTTTVDAATIAPWVGTEQKRSYTAAGDRLTVLSAPGRHPAVPDTDVVATLEWTRDG